MYNPYTRFRNQDLSLNDYLAIDRTVLANERTLLSFGRTALTLVVLGGTLIKFLEPGWWHALGWFFIAAGAAMMWRGWVRYQQMRQLLRAALEELTGTPQHPLKDKEKQKAEPTTPPEEPRGGAS